MFQKPHLGNGRCTRRALFGPACAGLSRARTWVSTTFCMTAASAVVSPPERRRERRGHQRRHPRRRVHPYVPLLACQPEHQRLGPGLVDEFVLQLLEPDAPLLRLQHLDCGLAYKQVMPPPAVGPARPCSRSVSPTAVKAASGTGLSFGFVAAGVEVAAFAESKKLGLEVTSEKVTASFSGHRDWTAARKERRFSFHLPRHGQMQTAVNSGRASPAEC
jgi:hypothetical protein